MRPDENPYVGPRPFEANDARFFFGRDAEVEDLLALILSNQVVLLYAASGAGKSSLLNAAVVDRLERDEQFEVLPVARVRGLREEVPTDRNVFVAAVLSSLASDRSTAESLQAYLSERPHGETTDGFAAPRALVIDQFEEIFTAYPERWEDRPGLFHDLAAALRDDPLLRVVLSIREDFLAQLDPYARLLPEGFRARYRLERLGRGAALRAVREPARAAGCAFADGVAEQLVEDLRKVRLDTEHGTTEVVDEFVEPVQLQVAAHSLWQALPDATTEITEEHRQRFGNVDEVLGDFYDDAISAAAAAAHMRQDSLRARFAHTFITPMGTRGTVFWTRDETGGIPARAIEELDARHLIRAELRAGARWYELTHDRLIEPIRASNRARDLRRRERRRRRGIVGGVIVGVGAAAIVATLLRTLGSSSNEWARSLTPLASEPADVGSINSISYANGGRGVLVVGDQQSQMLNPDGLQPLKEDLQPLEASGATVVNWQRWAVVQRGPVTLEARIDADHLVRGQLVLSRNHQIALVSEGPRFVAIALSRNASYAAFADAGGKVTVIDTQTKKQVEYTPPAGIRYATPAFGADESRVLFAASDGTIQRASTTRHDLGKPVKLSPAQAAGIAIDADGRLIAVYGDAAVVELRDRGGHLVGAVPGGDVVAAAFSPSGDRLATADRDGTVRIWRTRPDLVLDQPRLTRNQSDSTLVAVIHNIGTSSSTPTTVQSGAAQQAIPALAPGDSVTVRLAIRTLPRGIPADASVHSSEPREQLNVNNHRYVWTTGDRRAQIVAAALTGASRGHEIRDATLQAQAFQGVLHKVELPDIPPTANSPMFATWCYWQASVPDPNGMRYEIAANWHLYYQGHGHKTASPRPGDLVFYWKTPIAIQNLSIDVIQQASIAIYVGKRQGTQSVVRWTSGHPKVVPLRAPGTHLIMTYPTPRVPR